MTYIATVTSRGQMTIPSDIFRKALLRKGEKVVLSVDNGQVRIQSAVDLVNKLAGSVRTPDHLRGKDIDEIIEEAKKNYFRKKGSMI
jgi:bifunctional DNA-binding transcriptional regulator/antitoxin component of YhaV-PrlF toxin-antitoxin module